MLTFGRQRLRARDAQDLSGSARQAAGTATRGVMDAIEHRLHGDRAIGRRGDLEDLAKTAAICARAA